MPTIEAGRELFLSFRVSPEVYNELVRKRAEFFELTNVDVSLAQVAKSVLAKALGVLEPPTPTERAGARKGALRRKPKT